MNPAARINDQHICPQVTGINPHVGGSVLAGSPNVFINKLAVLRVGDATVCTGVGCPDPLVQGSATVLVNGLGLGRVGDMTSHGGTIVSGSADVLVG